MKHKILPDSPQDLKGIKRANEFIAGKILELDPLMMGLSGIIAGFWHPIEKRYMPISDFNFFDKMQDTFLLDPFCHKRMITREIDLWPDGQIFLNIDAPLTTKQQKKLDKVRYRDHYLYSKTVPLAYALAYGILEFYLEVIYEEN